MLHSNPRPRSFSVGSLPNSTFGSVQSGANNHSSRQRTASVVRAQLHPFKTSLRATQLAAAALLQHASPQASIRRSLTRLSLRTTPTGSATIGLSGASLAALASQLSQSPERVRSRSASLHLHPSTPRSRNRSLASALRGASPPSAYNISSLITPGRSPLNLSRRQSLASPVRFETPTRSSPSPSPSSPSNPDRRVRSKVRMSPASPSPLVGARSRGQTSSPGDAFLFGSSQRFNGRPRSNTLPVSPDLIRPRAVKSAGIPIGLFEVCFH